MDFWQVGKLNVPWNSNACILCLKEAELTVEHIIPNSLGGNLVCKFLCKECNSHCGHIFEAKAKSAPAIRLAISLLARDHSELQPLKENIERGQKYTAEFAGQKLTNKLGGDGTLNEGQLADGSLIIPEQRAVSHLKRILNKEGLSKTQIAEALKAWRDTPYGSMAKLSDETTVKKWENVPAKPTFHGASDISSLLLLKIVYEFLVLIAGTAILQPNPYLENIRDIILNSDKQSADEMVERLHTKKYETFHGICFHGNNPTAIFQIRLFGKLAYRVTLPNLSLSMETTVYTYCLLSKKHELRTSDGAN